MKNKRDNFIIVLCSMILLVIFATILYKIERTIIFSFFMFVVGEICFYEIVKNMFIDILSEEDFKKLTKSFLYIMIFFTILYLILTILVLSYPI